MRDVVDRHAFWRVGGSFSSVVAYVRAHGPSGFTAEDESASSPGQTPANVAVTYSRHNKRLLTATVVRLPGRNVIRVDAKVVWFRERPSDEVVPPAVREIDVSDRQLGPRGSRSQAVAVSHRVTDPSQVAEIVRWFDALPVAPHVTPMCGPALGSSWIELVFRSADRKRLASASIPDQASACAEAQFNIGGKTQTPLVDSPNGPSFVSRVEKLLALTPTS
jgi:hypothetical protein